jgi:hypothetical protein
MKGEWDLFKINEREFEVILKLMKYQGGLQRTLMRQLSHSRSLIKKERFIIRSRSMLNMVMEDLPKA